MRQSIIEASTPVTRQTHAVLDCPEFRVVPILNGFFSRHSPELESPVIIAEPLARARQVPDDLVTLGHLFAESRHLLECTAQMNGSFTVSVRVKCRASSFIEITN